MKGEGRVIDSSFVFRLAGSTSMALREHERNNIVHEQRDEIWRALRQVRWPLAGAMALAFALTQAAESLLLNGLDRRTQLLIDVLGWGLIGGLAIWLLLTWAIAQEQRYRNAQADALAEQRRLNEALQRSNSNLALLSEVNQRIASSATLDQVLDYAVTLPSRVIGADKAVLVLDDCYSTDSESPSRDANVSAPLVLRTQGLDGAQSTTIRAVFGLQRREEPPDAPLLLTLDRSGSGVADTPDLAACLVVPLTDGALPLGWLECYLAFDTPPPSDMQELLITIAGEIGEAVGATRRRVRELEARYALDRAVDEERARIARDMHDGIAQSLAFLRMRADLWSDWLETEPERLPGEFANFKTTLREQIDELRRAIFALRPLDLSELGFDGALRRLVSDFAAQQGWQATVSLDESLPDLPPELELTCFRLVQEALNNVAKHAEAHIVTLTLRLTDSGLSITVTDDGRGFDPGSVEGSDRLGLRQMRERIATLGGRLTLLSRPGEGTEVRGWVPL